MSEIIFQSSNVWIYLLMSILFLYILIKYRQEFSIKDLIGSLIYLTNYISVFLLFLLFGFGFIFTIVDFTQPNIINFFEEVIRGLLFYWFFSYTVFFGIRLIYWFKEFYAETDLFAYSMYEDKIKKEMNQK